MEGEGKMFFTRFVGIQNQRILMSFLSLESPPQIYHKPFRIFQNTKKNQPEYQWPGTNEFTRLLNFHLDVDCFTSTLYLSNLQDEESAQPGLFDTTHNLPKVPHPTTHETFGRLLTGG